MEVYKTLGLKAQPPQTELSTNPKPTFPANVEQDINALKAGEVTKVEFEPSGFNIYKVRSRNTIPMEQARAQIVREISQKNIDAALKAATSSVHSELNEQYLASTTQRRRSGFLRARCRPQARKLRRQSRQSITMTCDHAGNDHDKNAGPYCGPLNLDLRLLNNLQLLVQACPVMIQASPLSRSTVPQFLP